jgi:hypothetical protein
MAQQIGLVPMVIQMYRQLGIGELIHEDVLAAGTEQLEAELVAIAVEVKIAATHGLSLNEAVLDEANYPKLHRAHAVIDDILAMSVPPEIQVWVRRVSTMTLPPIVDELRVCFAQCAGAENSPMSFAAHFLLFEGTCLVLKLMARRTNGDYERVGGGSMLIDEIAADGVADLIADARTLPRDVRPFHLLIASAAVELTSVVEEMRRELALTSSELCEQLRTHAEISLRLRTIDPVEAALLQNDLHAVLGEQHLSVEELQRSHPALLGTLSRAALDQRASRARRRLREGGANGLPRRKQPSLYEFITTLTDELEGGTP